MSKCKSTEIKTLCVDGEQVSLVTQAVTDYDGTTITQTAYNLAGEIIPDFVLDCTPKTVGGFVPESETLIHSPSGQVIHWVQLLEDGTRELYYYENGELKMAANTQTTGQNAPVAIPALAQFVGEDKFEVYDLNADTTLTEAQIIADAVTRNTQLYNKVAVGQPLTTAAYIAKIVISLKPMAGGQGTLGEDARATTSEAIVVINGTTENMDPGGVQTFGDLRNGEFLMPSNFTEMQVQAGSVVVVSVVFATTPAGVV